MSVRGLAQNEPTAAARVALLDSMGDARLIDLAERRQAGTLTAVEKLAMAVLVGGPAFEEAGGMLIDAAQEEFAFGAYRVPVRVHADRKRCKIVVTLPQNARAQYGDYVRDLVSRWWASDAPVLVLAAGVSLRVMEFGGEGEPVEVVGGKAAG